MALVVAGTDFIQMPAGTTAQRPASPIQGMQRYNTTLGYTEVYTGSAWVGMGTQGAGASANGQVFTSNGTFTIPAGVTALKVTVVGGGGNSGAVNTGSYRFGLGGGGGGCAIKYLTGLTSGNTLAVTVGGAGGTSSVASGTQSITTISGAGGTTGTSNATTTNGVLGGSGTNGDINIDGGGSTFCGSFSPDYAIMSTGGNSIFGSMQRTRITSLTTETAGEAAINYGCGGSGGYRYASGSYPAYAGFQGIVIFEW